MLSVGPIQFATGFVVVGLLAAAYFLFKKKPAFLTQEKQRVKLIAKEAVSHDVCVFRFETAPGLALGLSAGPSKHLVRFFSNQCCFRETSHRQYLQRWETDLTKLFPGGESKNFRHLMSFRFHQNILWAILIFV